MKTVYTILVALNGSIHVFRFWQPTSEQQNTPDECEASFYLDLDTHLRWIAESENRFEASSAPISEMILP
jgi:hypothetical protein